MGLFSKRKRPPPPEAACSFCGKTRRHVKILIAGASTYICDACIGECNDIVAADSRAVPIDEDPIEMSRYAIMTQLGRLPNPVASGVRTKLLDALLVLSDGVEACREVARWALTFGDEERTTAAYEKVPPGSLEPWDRIHFAALLDVAGDPARGLRELDRIVDDALPDDARALLPLYRLSLRISAGQVSAAEVDDLLALAAHARDGVSALDLQPGFDKAIVRQAEIARAGLLRVRGDSAGALEILRAVADANEKDGHVWALIHDVCAERGEQRLAQEAKARALELIEPSRHTARRLKTPAHPFR